LVGVTGERERLEKLRREKGGGERPAGGAGVEPKVEREREG
jgi:hypothetical protein